MVVLREAFKKKRVKRVTLSLLNPSWTTFSYWFTYWPIRDQQRVNSDNGNNVSLFTLFLLNQMPKLHQIKNAGGVLVTSWWADSKIVIVSPIWSRIHGETQKYLDANWTTDTTVRTHFKKNVALICLPVLVGDCLLLSFIISERTLGHVDM